MFSFINRYEAAAQPGTLTQAHKTYSYYIKVGRCPLPSQGLMSVVSGGCRGSRPFQVATQRHRVDYKMQMDGMVEESAV